jgi:hypothetical protein
VKGQRARSDTRWLPLAASRSLRTPMASLLAYAAAKQGADTQDKGGLLPLPY